MSGTRKRKVPADDKPVLKIRADGESRLSELAKSVVLLVRKVEVLESRLKELERTAMRYVGV